MEHKVTAPHTDHSLGVVEFWECSLCRALSATAVFREYTDYDPEDHIWDHYIHIGAGIDFMVRPLEQSGIITKGSLLDIGCGYGFTLDYWEHIANGEATGLEPSGYGKRGAQELGVNIVLASLENASEIKSKKFDRLLSSEVIEHVPDPEKFVKFIRKYMRDDSILIITTPDAAFVVPENSLGTMMAVLSPGHHKFLFSQKSLRGLLEKCGFLYNFVDVVGERLVAYASDKPINISRNSVMQNENYLKYLNEKVKLVPFYKSLGLGLRYRLFKELVNDGNHREAYGVGQEIYRGVIEKYDTDILSIKNLYRIVGECSSIDKYSKIFPFFVPSFAFYAAMMARHGMPLGDYLASDMFGCAAALCADMQRFGHQYFQEAGSLYWVAIFEEGFARMIDGDKAAAFRLFERIRLGPANDEPHLFFCHRPDSLIQRAVVQSGVAKLQGGEPEVAMAIFRSVLQEQGARMDEDLVREAVSLWTVAKEQSEGLLAEYRADSRSDRDHHSSSQTLN